MPPKFSPDRVSASLDGWSRHEVDGPAEDFRELLLHRDVVKEVGTGRRLEGNEVIAALPS